MPSLMLARASLAMVSHKLYSHLMLAKKCAGCGTLTDAFQVIWHAVHRLQIARPDLGGAAATCGGGAARRLFAHFLCFQECCLQLSSPPSCPSPHQQLACSRAASELQLQMRNPSFSLEGPELCKAVQRGPALFSGLCRGAAADTPTSNKQKLLTKGANQHNSSTRSTVMNLGCNGSPSLGPPWGQAYQTRWGVPGRAVPGALAKPRLPPAPHQHCCLGPQCDLHRLGLPPCCSCRPLWGWLKFAGSLQQTALCVPAL